MKEVQIWVQTDQARTVQISCKPVQAILEEEFTIKTNPEVIYSHQVKTHEEDFYTAKLTLSGLTPGWKYAYSVWLDGKELSFDYPLEFQTQALWQYRTDPPPFTIAVGSCTFINEPEVDRPGKGYGRGYGIFKTIDEKNPDLMIWLGDNTYLREVDFWSRSGIFHRFAHSRQVPEMQPLLARTHHLAIWDDHDFGPNDSDRVYPLKEVTREAFSKFWANPSTGVPEAPKGITSFTEWNDIQIWLLDNRYFRSPNDCETCKNKTLLGEAQLEWLLESLAASRANFKLVCIGGQVLNTAEKFETYQNLHPEERAYLLKRIQDEGIKNVLFVDGDRHHTELSVLPIEDGSDIYDLTVSPLTSGAGTRNRDEANQYRVPETMVNTQNFGLLKFSGPRKERKLVVEIYDTEGTMLWTRELWGK